MNKKVVKRGLVPYVFLFLFIMGVAYFFNIMNHKVNVITYDEFMKQAQKGQVEEVVITPRSRASVYEITGIMKNYEENESFFVRTPLAGEVMDKILTTGEKAGFKISTATDPESSTLLLFIMNVLPMLILLGAAFYFITRQMGSANKSMDFGKSRARLNEDTRKVTFNEVAGLDEEKEEVAELIDFLKNPKRFQRLGARIPKGVLLVGPPGTGKTLLARAVAGEANVPFYYISGSDFVELFVGVGASRVRDMFKQAKHNAPCLIFIDEIDAVGRQRGAGLGGGHDEREQTLNQLLTEMDGFGANEGIIVIAATNRPDVLDPALLRPGRFDRQVQVNLPDMKGREEILKVHAKGKIFAKSVELHNIAERTVGFSGAELENLLNEAALLAVRREKPAITMSEIDEAHDRVLMGPAKKSKKYTDHDKKLVAYHEAGHAVLGIKLDGANDVHKITMIPRGYAGGYTMMQPKEERFTATKTELLERITGLLGGRVAEELVLDDITTGAQNDFQQATKIARAMVTEYGMSSLGPVQFESQDSGSVFLGRDYNKSRNFSGQVAFEIDQEMRKIIDECYKKATKIIKENRKLLDLIAESLLKYETLTKEQIDYLVENGCMPEDDGEIDPDDIEPASYHDLSLVDLIELAHEKKIKGYTKMNKEELIKALEEADQSTEDK
ncbi:MAG TPA: ATP-dependent zinc metalloprotease FtsH [Candidatus Fimihabitans intestinipullorum]|uniref:ATP-dependent zinc metalloprotease FtsH n=1 Tax=Candidatus Fimihabitans intestinipullorum TaxID=2840820 RepID=A0A9D1HVM6_9BACT|nr:ATP-dependent zinc metalloprotease FtsH [Candidatus Fimihabitans intestinipullorum]